MNEPTITLEIDRHAALQLAAVLSSARTESVLSWCQYADRYGDTHPYTLAAQRIHERLVAQHEALVLKLRDAGLMGAGL